MTSNFRISKNLEDRSSNFPNFRKALFQFRILLWKVRKIIFRCLYFLGKVRIASQLMNSVFSSVGSSAFLRGSKLEVDSRPTGDCECLGVVTYSALKLSVSLWHQPCFWIKRGNRWQFPWILLVGTWWLLNHSAQTRTWFPGYISLIKWLNWT